MTQELVESHGTEVQLSLNEMMGEYKKDDVTVTDIKIPKLLVMQQMSKFVAEQEICKAGDIVNSVNGGVYANGKEGEKVYVYPILGWKTWVVQESLGGKLEYRETVTAKDPSEKQWEETTEDGRTLKNTYCQSYYVFLEGDLGKLSALPHVITFRSTSLNEGRNISTVAATSNTPLFTQKFEIGAEKTSNDHGTWYKMTAKHVGDLGDNVPAANQLFKWWKTLKASTHDDVDNSEWKETAKAEKVDTSNCEF